MAPKSIALLLLVTTLAACNQASQSNQNMGQDAGTSPSARRTNTVAASSEPPPMPDPTVREASRALNRILQASGIGYVLYNPVGPPGDCVDGRDASGRIVRTCNVCAAVLTSDRGRLQIERSEFSIPLRRAISEQQPDIAPLDGSGVWVAAVADDPMGRGTIPRSRSYVSRRLTNDDLQPLQMKIQSGMGYGGTVCLPPPAGQTLGMCVISGSQPVMNALSTSKAETRMREIVGDCGGAASEQADAALPRLTESMPYSQVRRALIKSGWQPVDLARGRSCGWDRCPPFSEVLQCRAIADASCSYAWRRGAKWLMVIAGGENSSAEGQGFMSTRFCQTISVEHTGPEGQWVEYNCL